MKPIFISHAVADKVLVDLFVELLIGGIGISHTDIFYTSQRDQGIPSGKDFKSHIKDQLKETKLTFSLVSENYYNSAFCMCELGAVWIDSKDFIPLLIPPIDFKQLRATLEGVQARKIFSTEDLDIIRDETIRQLDLKNPRGTGYWTQKKEEFLTKGAEAATKLPKSDQVPRSALEKCEQEKNALQQEVSSIIKEKEKIEHINLALSKVKDSAAVAEVQRKFNTDHETFQELCGDAKDRLSELPLIVRKVLYAQFNGEAFTSDDSWDLTDLESARREGFLEQTEGANAYTTSTKSKRLTACKAALERLATFLEDESTPEFHKDFENNNDTPAEIKLAPFWRKHLGVKV
ncbi:toll/interleukin-1 receptor domain-containing protein [Corallococcus exiguus]|uniref:toll/interleukin-1 receptor domain-containing protein n=1 Tax=Corallococcus exiguus TaxID=83462 RepID=UPI003DA4B1BD